MTAIRDNRSIRCLLILIIGLLLVPLFLRALLGPTAIPDFFKARTIWNNSFCLFLACLALWMLNPSFIRTHEHGCIFLFFLIVFLTVFQTNDKRLRASIESDGIGYFSYLRSLYMDGDLDFTNEYADLDAYRNGVWAYADSKDRIPQTTATHMAGNLFSIGPALLWYPFYGATDLVYKPGQTQRTGYEPPYLQSILFAVLFYGCAGIILVYLTLARFFTRTASLASVLTILLLSPLYFYLKNLAFFSHVYSFFAVSLFLFFFAKYHASQRIGHWAALGLLAGLAALMRWQNAVYIAIPAVSALVRFLSASKNGRVCVNFFFRLAAMGSGFFFAIIPQLLAFQILYGKLWIIPQGNSFLSLWPRWGGQVLFSAFHGLFHWHPFLLLGVLGFFFTLQKKVPAVKPLFYSSAAGFAMQVYINGSIRQFHGGGSFGGRRFCDSLAFLAFGMANFIEHALTERRTRNIVWASGNLLFVLNAMLESAWGRLMLSLDVPQNLPELVGIAGQMLAEFFSGSHKPALFFLFFIVFVNLTLFTFSARKSAQQRNRSR